MGNKRIYLGREVSKYAEIAGGAILAITVLFFVLMAVGFEITGTDDVCLGNLDDPCVSYGKICNLGPDNYDIYNPESVKIDFSPTIKDYWIFFKDGRVKKEFLYNLGVNHSTAGWRYENFTNATKPRKDRVYVHRFAAYSCQNYMLVGLKENPEDVIKWGMGVGKEYLDPLWYGVNGTADTEALSMTAELGTELNITGNLSGVTNICFNVDYPTYSDTCYVPNGLTTNSGNDYSVEGNDSAGSNANDGDWSTYTTGPDTSPNLVVYENYTLTISEAVTNLTFRAKVYSATTGGTIKYWNYSSNGWTSLASVTDNSIYTEILEVPTDGYSSSPVRFKTELVPDVLSGTAYFEGNLTADYGNSSFLLDRDYFRKEIFNDSSTALNLTYSSAPENKTTYFEAHQYDEIRNLSVSLSAFPDSGTTMEGIKIYMNGTEVADIGTIYEGFIGTITDFNGSKSNVTFTDPGFQDKYLKILSDSEVSSATLNLTGFNYTGHGTEVFNFSQDPLFKEIIGATLITDWIEGVAFDGTYIYLNNGDDTIAKYTEDGAKITTGTSPNNNIGFQGSTICGGYLWVATDEDTIEKYSTTDLSYVSGFSTGAVSPYGLGCNGTHIISTDYPISSECNIYFWDVNDGSQDDSKDLDAIEADNDYCTAVDMDDDGNFWSGDVDGYFYVYNSTWDYQYKVSTGGEDPDDIEIHDYQMLWGRWTGGYRQIDDYLYTYYINSAPNNALLEIGSTDGTYEWNYTGRYQLEETTNDLSAEIETALSTCSADEDNYCLIPFHFYSEEGGIIEPSEISITFTSNPNPITLDLTTVQNFINSSSGFVDVPISVSSSDDGKIQLDNLGYDYAGGNDTIRVTVYEMADSTNNDTLDILYYYSRFITNMPYSWTDDLFFLPRTKSSKNVSAYGQTSTTPIYNLSFVNYGGMDANLSIKVNETFSCMNMTWSTTSTKPGSGNIITDTWSKITSALGFGNDQSIFIWADLENCNASDQRILNPTLDIEAYCEECVWEGT